MNREVLDRWCERGILALVLAVLVFGPLALGAVRMREFLVLQGLTCGVMLLWGARFWLSPRPKVFWPPICWAVTAFVLYAIARYLTADIEYVARQELLRVLVYAFLFFAILNNLHGQDSTQVISVTLIFLAMAISFYAVYQFLTDSPWVWHFHRSAEHRGSGTYISPNHLAGFLELLLPLGLAYTLAGRLKPVMKVFLGYATLVIFAGIVVTVSRGAWVSSGLALLLFFSVLAWHRSYRLPSLAFLLVLVGAGFLFLPARYSFKHRLNQLVWDVGQTEGVSRYALWESAVRLWQDHPWWGVGPGHFDYCFRAYRPEQVQMQPEWAHNDYLNTLADWGAAGTALVASAWVLLGLGIFKTWRVVRGTPSDLGGQRRSNKFAFVVGASFGLSAILFHSMVDFNMHIPANAILAVTLMALLSGHLRFATERYWAGMGAPARVFASVLVLAGLAFLGQQGWRLAGEQVWLERAARAPEWSPEHAALLTKAFAAEPMDAATAYAIGEDYRVQSEAGGENYRDLAATAMEWFARCMKLNPLDGYGFMRYGMCLDWLDRPAESAPYFDRADQLDPNGYFTMANIGEHYMQLGDPAAARAYFERSLRLQPNSNQIAQTYLRIANQRLLDAATNEIGARLILPPR